MNIGDRIQHLRKSKGISQEELADKIGVSRQAVSKWESEQSVRCSRPSAVSLCGFNGRNHEKLYLRTRYN